MTRHAIAAANTGTELNGCIAGDGGATIELSLGQTISLTSPHLATLDGLEPIAEPVTLRIEPSSDDGLRVVYDMVRRRGGITHVEWNGRFDGQDYPVQGVDYVLTNAYRRLSDQSYEIAVRVDGRDAAVATAAVSADGKTMTVNTVEKDASGNTTRSTAVSERSIRISAGSPTNTRRLTPGAPGSRCLIATMSAHSS